MWRGLPPHIGKGLHVSLYVSGPYLHLARDMQGPRFYIIRPVG